MYSEGGSDPSPCPSKQGSTLILTSCGRSYHHPSIQGAWNTSGSPRLSKTQQVTHMYKPVTSTSHIICDILVTFSSEDLRNAACDKVNVLPSFLHASFSFPPPTLHFSTLYTPKCGTYRNGIHQRSRYCCGDTKHDGCSTNCLASG